MNRLVFWLAAISAIFLFGMTPGLLPALLGVLWWAFLGWLALTAIVVLSVVVILSLFAIGDFLDRVFGQ